jgi:DNA-directed RNA polymerase specialized sigma24 family protein
MDTPKRSRSSASESSVRLAGPQADVSGCPAAADIDWEFLRRRAVAAAMTTLRNQAAAEDAAQDALLHILKRGTNGINHLDRYVRECAHNAAVDQVRKWAGRIEVLSALESRGQTSNRCSEQGATPDRRQADSETTGPGSWQHRQKLNPEHVLNLLRDVFCVLCSAPDAAVSLFTRTVLLTCFSPSQRAEAMNLLKQALASPRAGTPMSLAERRFSSLPWLGALPPEELSGYVDDLFAAMQYVLSDLSFLRSHTELLAVAIRSAATVVRGMQDTLKRARLDIIMRSKAERHSLYDSRLGKFAACIDALYVAAHIPRSYTVAGIVYYLHELTNTRVRLHNLLDTDYVESYLAGFALSKFSGNYLDRWVAIIGLAMLYELNPGALHHRQHLLSEVEGKVRLSPVERVGTAFAWLNSEQSNRKDVIDHKVLQLVNVHEASELSVLPITLYAPTLFRGGICDPRTELQELLWEVIHRALNAKSHIAKIGALRHLFYTDGPAMRHAPEAVRSAVLALQGGENRVLAGMACQVQFT